MITKRELINLLEASEKPDACIIKIETHTKNRKKVSLIAMSRFLTKVEEGETIIILTDDL